MNPGLQGLLIVAGLFSGLIAVVTNQARFVALMYLFGFIIVLDILFYVGGFLPLLLVCK